MSAPAGRSGISHCRRANVVDDGPTRPVLDFATNWPIPAPGVTSNTTRNDARGRRLMRTMIIHTVRLSQVGALIAADPAFPIADP